MKRPVLAGFGLLIGLALLTGCVPPPSPMEVAMVPEPPPPPPPVVLISPSAAPIWGQAVRRHAVRVAHPVVHRHWVRRYSSVRTSYVTTWTPGCGSVAHPCTVEHTTAPIQ